MLATWSCSGMAWLAVRDHGNFHTCNLESPVSLGCLWWRTDFQRHRLDVPLDLLSRSCLICHPLQLCWGFSPLQIDYSFNYFVLVNEGRRCSEWVFKIVFSFGVQDHKPLERRILLLPFLFWVPASHDVSRPARMLHVFLQPMMNRSKKSSRALVGAPAKSGSKRRILQTHF